MNCMIRFCADGVLRAKYSNNKPMLPLTFIQQNSPDADNDLRFWVEIWDNIVEFEEGLTISSFLFCLEPWVNFWSDLTRINIQAYLQEVRKPAIVKENENSWFALAYYTEFSLFSTYLEDDDALFEEDMMAWFDTPRETSLSSKWDISSYYSINQYELGKNEKKALETSPFNEIANIKLVLVQDHKVIFNDSGMREYFGDKDDQLFQPDSFGVNTLMTYLPLKFLVGTQYHNMKQVVEGFFKCMYKDPIMRDQAGKKFEGIAEYALEQIIAEENTKLENSKKDNVVSLFKDTSKNNTQTNREDKTVTNSTVINIMDRKNKVSHEVESNDEENTKVIQQSNVEEEFVEEDIYWETLLNRAKVADNIVLKIGKFKEALPLENRLHEEIIDPNDEKANTKDTPYKKI